MCEPTTIVMVGMAVAGAATAYSAYQTGQTEKEFANYEAKQADADAQAERGAAQVEADRIRQAGARAAAEANAGLAASGQSLGSAGALALNREIYRGAAEDSYWALLGGKDRALRLNTQGALTRARGKQAGQAGTLSAFATLAQTASGTYTGWKTAKGKT